MTATTENPDFDSHSASDYLQAQLHLQQAELVETANGELRKAHRYIDRKGVVKVYNILSHLQQEEKLPIDDKRDHSTSESSSADNLLPMTGVSGGQQVNRHSHRSEQALADDLSDHDETDNNSELDRNEDESDNDSMSAFVQKTRNDFPLHHSSNRTNKCIISCFEQENHPTSRDLNQISDLNSASRQELQKEIIQLREALQTCCKSLVSIKLNADVKIQKLQLQVVYLERKLSDEQAKTSKLSVSNQSLRREMQAAYHEAENANDILKCRKMIALHQRELTVEKHLNSLLVARNHVVKQNTELKRMLLQTCPDCREKLPLKRARNPPPQSPQVSAGLPEDSQHTVSTLSPLEEAHPATPSTTSTTSSKPTWMSSARSVLDKIAHDSVEKEIVLPEEESTESTKSSTATRGSLKVTQPTTKPLMRRVDNATIPPTSGRSSVNGARPIEIKCKSKDKSTDKPGTNSTLKKSSSESLPLPPHYQEKAGGNSPTQGKKISIHRRFSTGRVEPPKHTNHDNLSSSVHRSTAERRERRREADKSLNQCPENRQYLEVRPIATPQQATIVPPDDEQRIISAQSPSREYDIRSSEHPDPPFSPSSPSLSPGKQKTRWLRMLRRKSQ